MSESLSQKFSLYSWLFKKLRKELIIWYFFTFLSSFFYYQAAHGLKIWGYKEWIGYSTLFGTVVIKTRGSLLLYAFFCFFVGYLLTSLICDYWKNYTLELCRKQLRQLILNYSSHNPSQAHFHNKEILSNFLGEVELFVTPFISVPHRIYSAIVNIILTLIFMASFKENNFAISFVIVVSLILVFLSFFTYQIQKEINQQQNKFRQQENLAMEKYLEKLTESQKVKKLINSNFQKNHSSLKKKTLSYLPNLSIMGLGILFCCVYVINYGTNWETKEFAKIYLLAGSIQTIFWKAKEIIDNSLEISKIKVHYKPLQKILNKL
jgi:ABC-type multidrug transport system fused ATPase/permease subunit